MRENNFLVLAGGPTKKIVVEPEKMFITNFTSSNSKFHLSFHYNGFESYMYLDKTKICNFQGFVNIPAQQFCFVCVSK